MGEDGRNESQDKDVLSDECISKGNIRGTSDLQLVFPSRPSGPERRRFGTFFNGVTMNLQGVESEEDIDTSEDEEFEDDDDDSEEDEDEESSEEAEDSPA